MGSTWFRSSCMNRLRWYLLVLASLQKHLMLFRAVAAGSKPCAWHHGLVTQRISCPAWHGAWQVGLEEMEVCWAEGAAVPSFFPKIQWKPQYSTAFFLNESKDLMFPQGFVHFLCFSEDPKDVEAELVGNPGIVTLAAQCWLLLALFPCSWLPDCSSKLPR